jgi:LysR family nitrogen assimilation transcriptional regulator
VIRVNLSAGSSPSKNTHMDARELKMFLKIVELGSISRAADALGIAQPSLSQQLLRLEDEVGSKLFRRTARGVTTTEAGRVFEEHARHILRTIDQALENVRQLKLAPTGQVTFALPISVNQVIGLPLVQAALKHAPTLSLRLVESYSRFIRGWIEDGSVDLGLMYDLGPARNLTIKKLAREALCVIGPPDRFKGIAAASITMSELAELPLILPSPQHGLRQFIEDESQRLQLVLNVATEIDSISHIAHLVAAGHGCSILSLSAVHEHIESRRVSVGRLLDGALQRTLCLVRNPSSVVTHASVRIEDLTVKIMRRLIVTNRWRAELEPNLA